MKRAFPQKVKPASVHLSPTDAEMASSRQTSPGVNRRARTSAAMIGLAISMGVSNILLPRHTDGAAAAEAQSPESTLAAVSDSKASLTNYGQPTSGSEASTSAALVSLRVQRGQTLWKIARQYQLTVDELAVANGIRSDSILQVGQLIRVPVSGSALLTLRAVNSGLESSQSSESGAPQLSASAKPKESLENAAVLAAEGERNASLSRLRLQREQLRQVLAELPHAPQPQVSRASKRQTGVDALSAQSGVTLQAVVKPQIPAANRSIYQVKPVDTSRGVAMPSVESSTASPEVAATSEAPAVPQVSGVSTSARDLQATSERADAAPVELVAHQVEQGETINSIARTYQISSASLVAVNRLSDPNFIRVGQTIEIPVEQTELGKQKLEQAAQSAPQPTVEAPSTVLTGASGIAVPTVPTLAAAATVDTSSTAIFSTEFIDSTNSAVQTPVTVPPTAVAAPKVAPSTAAQPTTIPVTEAVSSPSQDGANLYVARLMSEFTTLGDRIPANQVQQLQAVAVSTAPASSSEVNPELRPAQSVDAVAVRSPGMERQARQESVSGGSGGAPERVAVAPMGSENYEPLLQPVTGRLVAPELPPLPGAENFLPNGSGPVAGFIWPARGVLTSGYGWRWGRMHRGVDVAGPVGTPIHAAADGVVQFAGWNSGGYGNMVEIRHADGTMTRYAHNSRNLVRVGQQVQQGQQIAEMGSTGYSTGPHVHFEVHLPNQGTVNPVAMLPSR